MTRLDPRFSPESAETGATAYCSAGLFVGGVLTLPLAVLLHLDTFTIILLVLDRDVVAALARFTRQRDVDSLLVLCHDGQPTFTSGS